MTTNNTPFAYLGVDSPDPRNTWRRRRAPTVSDFRPYSVGDRWIDTVGGTFYVLVDKTNGIATWTVGGGGAGTLNQISTDVGGPAIPFGGNLNLFGTNGLQTSAVGATINLNDRRWLSAFVVDPTPNSGEYTTIQAAITAASAGDVIYVRGATYVENLTLKVGVDIIAVAVDGRIPNPPVQIIGNHTFNTSGIAIIQGIAFSAGVGSVFTITGGPGVTPFLALKYCNIAAVTGSAATLTGGSGMILFSSNADAQLATFNLTDAQIQVQEASSCSSNSAECFLLNANAQAHLDAVQADGSTSCITINAVTSAVLVTNSTIFAPTAGCILFNAAGSAQSVNNIMRGNAPSGFYVEGAGTYRFAGDVPTDSATQIDPATTQAPFVWRPFGTSGTTVTAVRGTVGFDSSQFSVVDGFVQATGSGITWTDQGVSTTVLANSGSFATAGVAMTLTLPTAAPNGTTCEFKLDGIGPLTVMADVADKIRIGAAISVVGGTATTTAQGDALTLTYRSTASTWIANSVVGLWNVV